MAEHHTEPKETPIHDGDGRLTTVLCSCAVAWVKQNPEVIAPLEADYIR